MNELQLVGYTADLKYLVFSDAGVGTARYKVLVDEDLEATVTEVLLLVDPGRTPLRPSAELTSAPPPDHPEADPVPTAPSGADAAPGDGEPEAGRSGPMGLFDEDEDDLFAPAPAPAPAPGPAPRNSKRDKAQSRVGSGALAAQAVLLDLTESPGNGAIDADALDSAPESKLSPRKIQALLRAGQSPRQVAKQADTEERWVLRWLAPIEAERDLVLEAVQRRRVSKARLGESHDTLGEAVRKNLADKGIGMDDEHVVWSAARREGDTHWTVTLRYRSRGRKQRAIWLYNPETGELVPEDALAVNIAWTPPRARGRRATTARKQAPRKAAKKSAKKAGRKAVQKSAKKRAAKRTQKRVKKTAAKRGKKSAKRAAVKGARPPARRAKKGGGRRAG